MAWWRGRGGGRVGDVSTQKRQIFVLALPGDGQVMLASQSG